MLEKAGIYDMEGAVMMKRITKEELGKPTWHDGYKIVRVKNFRYYSLIEDTDIVEYGVLKIANKPPNCGALTVFDSYENAIHFIGKQREGIAVYHCKYTVANECLTLGIWIWNSEGHYIENHRLPIGTVRANSVVLIERVYHI
jgi:hypothetical protein